MKTFGLTNGFWFSSFYTRISTMTSLETLKFDTAHLSNDANLQKLFSLAMEARDYSYCPYSRFRVGACLLTESDEFITGM